MIKASRTSNGPNAAKRAFTLIELLVVIAIIALLAAILFPVFATVREKARQSSCASNMKQIGLAALQYCQDYDERLPSYVSYAGSPMPLAVMYPYYRSDALMKCPSDESKPYTAGTRVDSYAWNSNLSSFVAVTWTGPFGNNWGQLGYTLADLPNTTKTIMSSEVFGNPSNYGFVFSDLTDTYSGKLRMSNGIWNGTNGGDSATGDLGGGCGTVRVPGQNKTTRDGGKPRHSGGANYLCVDGHVKWMLGDNVSPGTNAATASAAQNPAQCTASDEGWNGPLVAEGTSNGTHQLTFSRF